MYNNSQTEIFESFKSAVNEKANKYFVKLGLNIEIDYLEESQWITKIYKNDKNEVRICVSLHHLDYADGISIVLKNNFGEKHLLTEVQKYSNNEVPVYLYWVDKIESELNRIIEDFKEHLEKYIINEK